MSHSLRGLSQEG